MKAGNHAAFTLLEAQATDLDALRGLMRRYQTWTQIDLCFQHFEAELAALPGAYVKPRGNLWIARRTSDQEPLGCIAVKPLNDAECEMKRLWVEDAAKGMGVGRALAQTSVDFARAAGYRTMKLDTLRTRMPAAISLYRSLGFEETDAYVHNPEPDVLYMALQLVETQ
ncbi:MAG: GNAT family N-acetyltransferase [Burkholderiales bacterium]|nr:MAG: GNAT family N-acetyltransferase [Betaproteobacteria bacterium]TAG81280.1 MAG: GNAT family N-acetyltransferase [Burkholderiales bacterium]